MKLLLVLAAISLVQANIYYDLSKEDYDEIKKSRDFTGKVALVTGSNSGIGEGIVKLFSALGANVVVTGRNAASVKNVSDEVQQLSPKNLKPLQVVADLTKDADVERLVNETVKAFGKIDILVNNAGASSVINIEDPKFIQTFDNTLNIDLRAPALLNHYAVPYLKKTNGTIIHTSSDVASVPMAATMPYNMAKTGIDMMTKCLALALGPNVRVNAVNPGDTDTNFGGPAGSDKTKRKQKVIDITPLKRLAQPIDIAKGVAFLASSDASFITGANLYIDGGLLYTLGGLR